VLAPERADVHEATGELYLKHACYKEAITAFNTAAKLAGSFSPRLAYARALAYLAVGRPGDAVKDLNRTLRLNPNLTGASRARDGAAALQMALDGDHRHAHVRFNILLHPRLHGANANGPPDSYGGSSTYSSDGLPSLFLNHELVLYRGVCSLYLGDCLAAAQDFQAALELAQQNAQLFLHQVSRLDVSSQQSVGETTHDGSLESRLANAHPPELMSQEGQHAFECEMLYNIVLCQLLAKDHRAALTTCERLLQRPDALALVGSSAECLIWFLVGVCRLALGEGRSDEAREAFMHSYSHDPVYVDDFLRRHEPNVDHGYGGGSTTASGSSSGAKSRPFRPIGGPSPPPGCPAPRDDVCDAAPEAVCCLLREQSRLSSRFSPLRLQVKDVVIWGRPSLNWPFVRTPELVPSSSLARLDILSHHEVGVNPAPPWDRLS
jgi:tetratricopeptide (TPR) repeat protein